MRQTGFDSALRVPSQPERRRSRRRPHVVGAFLFSPTGGSKIAVASVDLSKHGIRLSVREPIACGTYHRLELGMGEQQTASEIRILSCRKEPDGTYHVHAEFC